MPYAIAAAIIALLLIAPLWTVSIPGMPDYPAHLADFYLIRTGAQDAALAQFYQIHWAAIPNLASEILVPALARLLPLELAARLFISAAVAMWALGPSLIHRALYGRFGLAPLAGAFFAYNANFMWGFLNFYFAMGLAMLVFAAWLADDRPKRAAGVAGFALIILVVYFCHLFAAATLLMLITGAELMLLLRTRPEPQVAIRQCLPALLAFLPTILAFLFLKPHSAGDLGIQFDLLESMRARAASLFLPYFYKEAFWLPAALFALLLLAILARRAALHPRLQLTLAVLLLAALLAPEWAMGGWGVHLRLPAFFAALLFASAGIRLPARVALFAMVLLVAVAGWNAWVLAAHWRSFDRQARELRAALDTLPHGQRIFTVLDDDNDDSNGKAPTVYDQPYWHLAELAIMDRGAFTPLLFTTRGQHVVEVKPPYDRHAAATAMQGGPVDIGDLEALSENDVADNVIRDQVPYLLKFQCHFDKAVVIHLGGQRTPPPPTLRLVRQGSVFSLHDVIADKTCLAR